MRLRIPNAANSEDEWLQIYNLDLPELTPSQLYGEIWRAARIVARNPRGIVWRGTIPMPVREWADSRITLCRALLRRGETPKRAAGRGEGPPKRTARAWVR